jgi:hypothetical protein
LPSGEEGDPVWRNCFFLQVQVFHVQSICVILSWYIHSGYAKLFIFLIRFLLVTTGWDKKEEGTLFHTPFFKSFTWNEWQLSYVSLYTKDADNKWNATSELRKHNKMRM